MLEINQNHRNMGYLNKIAIILLLISLLSIKEVQSACSCLTSSIYGDTDSNGNCVIYQVSCNTCSSGCPKVFKYQYYSYCWAWGLVDIYGCTNCPSFCKTCSAPTSCSECLVGYGLDSSQCVSCSTLYGAGCIQCSSTQCTLCSLALGYVIDTSSTNPACFLCSSITNCTSCIDGPKCQTCAAGSYKNTSLLYSACQPCSKIPNCDTCLSLSSTPYCSKCLTGFYHNRSKANNQCVPCSSIDNCNTCQHGPKCKVCNVDWYLDFGNHNKTCVPCSFIPNCDLCVDGPYCTKCLAGFHLDFFSQNRTCVPCTLFKCLECTDGPVCTKCQSGYFLNISSNQCLQCIFPCIECGASGSECTKCPSSLLYSLNTGTQTCDLCFHALPNCLTCDQAGTQCYQCTSTQFYVDSLTKQCVTCVSPCKDCLSITECLSCVNDSYAYLSNTKECVLCSTLMPRCSKCLQESVCTACTTAGGPFYLSFPPNSCLTCQQARPHCLTCASTAGIGPTCTTCENKFYLENYSCFPCPASCALCTGLTSCSTCINSAFALHNQVCPPCSQLIPNCLQCSSATTCTMCTNNTIINSSGGCSVCTLTQYPDEINQLCKPCVSPCYSCLNNADCLTCEVFYEYIPAIKRCQDLCGDSVVMTDQCDNSFGILHDGCSDTCQEEPDYTCVLHPDTVSGQSVHRSICSYDLNVNITLKHIQKEPFKNTLTWTYVIVPFLYGLPGTTSRDYTQEQLMKTFVLYDINQGPPAALSSHDQQNLFEKVNHQVISSSSPPFLIVESVSVNPSKSEVSVTFSHQQDITQSDIRLFLNFTYLKTRLNIPNFTTTPDSDKIIKVASYRPESMIGKFYTEQEYSLASTLNKVALLIGILSFVAFVIGLCSKELVGLQMAMLCQFAYISLFYFDGTLQLPLFALKSLVYSTGYNLQSWSDITTFTLTDNNPPQSLTLDYDTMTFSHNFNLMALLYLMPLIVVIPFIPMKAKCIRKLSMIEMGHKWVDLLLGEIMLYIVLFNLQYFLFGMIVFYRDGRNVKEYLSSMIVSFGGLLTLVSIFGLILKPQIYGNFRTSFKYDTDLRSQIVLSKPKMNDNACKKMIQRFNLFVNENYFWKNYRTFHSVLTYNHYFILSVYFIISIMVMTLLENFAIINLALSGVMLIEVALMRPYNKVSQKVRAIYFFIIFTVISFVRYSNNTLLKEQYNLILSIVLVGLLALALIWTYIVLIDYFYLYFTEEFSDRKGMIQKVFKIETDQIDKDEVAEQQEALMRKLMKKYERVQLQVNFNNARNQLLSGYDSLTADKPLSKNTQISKPFNQGNQIKMKFIDDEVLKRMQEENDFTNLKQQVAKQKNKIKKEDMKKKVTGQKLLKLLSLDNFNKYEQKFLMPDQKKLQIGGQNEGKQQQNIFENNEKNVQKKQIKHNKLSDKIVQQQQSVQEQSQDSKIKDTKQIESIEPQEDQNKKQDEEKILIEQNQFIRYTRAKKIITNQGLTIDFDLIANNFDKI